MENGKDSLNEHADQLPEEALSGMYKSWFLDYASYVILERAVPSIEDGFKPVQRRIMHAMKEMDDGRFNKVANIIGSTMQYHPHGDASIGDAIVNIGQKDILIETQGNWGDIRTGDRAAAARYIEARLSKFALEVVFNAQTTDWQSSYDGRKKEPVHLPVKFPLLLSQGAEGIAVGLATKIMPHNFCELIKGSIDLLNGKEIELVPDFPTGGMADFSSYNNGLKGGKIRVRAKIKAVDNKRLIISEIPFGSTTQGLIESIIKANDSGKIKIKKVTDNTAKHVEIEVMLAPGQSPDVTIAALFAFTDCESSISPNTCVVINDTPHFIGVTDILKHSTLKTKDLLKQELEIRKGELQEKILFSSLEKIFIENRIYRDIEECETWEAVLETIDRGLDPYKKDFYREINRDDIIRLTEIKIKRISRFDSFKADEAMKKLEDELKEVNKNLQNLVVYAIAYFERLLDKFTKGRERKTEIATFDTIKAAKVAANNAKLYVNRKEGFIGYGLKKDEYLSECSDIDEIIVFRKDGRCLVTKIADKVFVGKDILHAEVFIKNDERKVFNLMYIDGKTGITRAKRFNVKAVTRNKEYDLTTGTKGTKVLHFSANPNGEAETITVFLNPSCNARNKVFDYDFADLDIKGRGSQGNIVTKHPVKRTKFKKEGVSTLTALNIYYDAAVGRLNKDKNGILLGKFNDDEKIMVVYKNGEYELTNYELTNRYENKQILKIQKFNPETILSVIHFDGGNQKYFVKRFKIETTTLSKKYLFISDNKGSKMEYFTTKLNPEVEITLKTKIGIETEQVALKDIIDVKGWKANGNRLSLKEVTKIEEIISESEVSWEVNSDGKAVPKADESGNDEDDKEQLEIF